MKDYINLRVTVTKRTIIVSVVMALAAIGIAIWMTIPGPTPKDILAQAGYLEIVPPSTFHGPGTLNTIEEIDDGSIQLHPTCEFDQTTLLALRMESGTLDQELRQRLRGKFDVTAAIEENLASASGGSINLARIRSVMVRLENSKILMMSDEALFRVRGELLHNSCAEAVAINISSGGRICQSQSVLQADLIYEVNLEESVDLEQQAEIMRDMSSALELNLSREGGSRMQAERLYFGIKLNPHGVILNTPDATPVDCRVALE